VGENVRGLTNWNGGLVFDEVQADLEAEGYQVTPFLLPACAVNAPHRRDRIWFVAYSSSASKGAKELRQIRRENGEINREGSQTIYDATRPNGLEGITSDSTSLGFCEHSSREKLFSETFGTQFRMDKQNASDSQLKGLQGCTNTGEVSSKKGTLGGEGNKFTTQFASIDKESNASDFDGFGLRGQSNRIGNSRLIGKNSKGNNWQNFPTVSPICDANDGISDRLDSITFPKWRNESIKAGGNAIVPQVVYQIFKAIQQYNELDKQLTI
jgi:DNA (cytosine-5)-methyltransferase 1